MTMRDFADSLNEIMGRKLTDEKLTQFKLTVREGRS